MYGSQYVFGELSGDRNCQTQCRNNSTPEANQRFSAITDCLIESEHYAGSKIDYDCLQAQCSRERNVAGRKLCPKEVMQCTPQVL